MAWDNKANLGRRVYVYLSKNEFSNSDITSGKAPTANSARVVLAYDPSRDVNLCTRIDFWVRHVGQSSGVNGGAYVICNLDLYNIGPAIRQFLDAYNQYNQGFWKATETKKYSVMVQVGYKNKPLQTIFVGYVGSFNVEWVQTDKSVDEVWHLFSQWPDVIDVPQEENKASPGEDYAPSALTNVLQTYKSGEAALRDTVMHQKRTVYVRTADTDAKMKIAGFEMRNDAETATPQMSVSPVLINPVKLQITPANFDTYFSIKYVKSLNGKEPDPELKEQWTRQQQLQSFVLGYDNLPKALRDIAMVDYCDCYVEVDMDTGKQIIYIYRIGNQIRSDAKGGKQWTITNFENLHKAPTVSAGMIQFDMVLEPRIKNMDTITLKLDSSWKRAVPSFNMNFNNAKYATTVFGGASALGIYNVTASDKAQKAMAGFGNIFEKAFYALFIEHTGSTHTDTWSTKVDCYGLEALEVLATGGNLNG